MTPNDFDQLDEMMSSDDVLTPSSGFAAGVMDAVREAASEPPPLPFPWLRFAAGLIACGVVSGSAFALVSAIDWSIFVQPIAELRSVAIELAYAAVVLGLALGLLRVQRTFMES
jgi:hypothetical protein